MSKHLRHNASHGHGGGTLIATDRYARNLDEALAVIRHDRATQVRAATTGHERKVKMPTFSWDKKDE